MFVLLTEFQPFGLDESVVLDGSGAFSKKATKLLFLGRFHAVRAGSGAGLDEGHDVHRGGGISGNVEFDKESFVKGWAVAVDGLIHGQSALAIDDVAATVFLVTAEGMRMLDDDGVGTD